MKKTIPSLYGGIFCAVCCLLWHIPAAASSAASSYTIAAATDLHYISPKLTDNGAAFTRVAESGDGKAVLWCEEITDTFLQEVISLHPDCLILTGDLSFNGEKQSHEDLAGKLMLVEEQQIPVYVLPGNHDLDYPYAASYAGDQITLTDRVSPEEFAKIYAPFGYEEAFSRDPASLSYAAVLAQEGENTPELWLLMIDVNMPDSPGELKEETLLWAKEILEMTKEAGALTAAASHQNLIAQNELFNYGYRMEQADPLLELYEAGPVLFNLSGHIHMQHCVFSSGGLPDLAGGALITAPNPFALLTVACDPQDEPEKPADGQTGPAAGSVRTTCTYQTRELDFPHREDALAFLRKNAVRQNSSEEISDEVLAYITDFYEKIIAGRADLFEWDEELYQQVCAVNTMFGYYMLTVRKEGMNDCTSLSWQPAV